MRLIHEASGSLQIRGRRVLRAPFLVGLALVLVPVGSLMIAETPLTARRVGAAAAVSAVALLFLRYGAPRPRRVVVTRTSAPRIAVDGGALRDVPEGAELRLTAVPGHEATAAARYGVVLGAPGEAPLVVLADEDPAAVVRDLSVLRRVLTLPLSPGWGLARSSSLLEFSASSGEPAPELPVPGASPPPSRGKLALTLAAGAVGAGIVLGLEVRSRLLLGETPSALDLTLPLVFITALLAIAAVIRTDGSQLRVSDALSYERRVLGVVVRRLRVPRSSIRAAHLVAPDGTAARHLLLDTDGGPVALPTNADEGRRILEELGLTAAGR